MQNGIGEVAELALIEKQLDRCGFPAPACAALVASVTEEMQTHVPVRRLASEMRTPPPDDAFERALVLRAVRHNWDQIDTLRVVESVRTALRRELLALIKHRATFPIGIGNYNFVIACKMATFRRFPCGPMDWELSGIPLSWAPQMTTRGLAGFMRYVALEMRGRRPLFFMHVAPAPRSRALVIEKEMCRSWHRMAASLDLQPEVKGIAANAWFLDPAALRAQSHLECLNAPFTKWGGFVSTAGFATAESGVLERNRDRARRFLSGDLRYRMGVGLWSRKAATEWSRQHPEFAD